MRSLRLQVQNFVRSFWRGLRQWCGDSAYETYLAHAQHEGGAKVLNPGDFYVEQLNRKYSRPNRCC